MAVPDIIIEQYNGRGWVVSGTQSILFPGNVSDLLKSGSENFVVQYLDGLYTYPIVTLPDFLGDSSRYVPYPSSITMRDLPQMMTVGSEHDVQINVYCTNGANFIDDNIKIVSSNSDVLSVTDNKITAIAEGSVTIKAVYMGASCTLPIICLASNRKLFPQVDSNGLFPWN